MNAKKSDARQPGNHSITPSSPEAPNLLAHVDFACLETDCRSAIEFNIMQLEESKGIVSCPVCPRGYHFDEEFLDKLCRLRSLIFAIQGAGDILGSVNVAVQTMTHEVKVPYNLLLTRMNTVITLDVGEQKVDFNFRIEPLNNGSIK